MADIVIIGERYWLPVAADLLCRAGFDARPWEVRPESLPAVLRRTKLLRGLGYFLCQPFRSAKAIHCVSPNGGGFVLKAARIFRKRIILHWIGTDVMQLHREVQAGRTNRLEFFKRVAHAHFADSPEIIQELAELGIVAELFRLLPARIESQLVPMPQEPGVLTYWSPQRRAFYRGQIIDALAEEFPEMAFYVAGSDGAGEPQHPNMRYLGWVRDLEEVYGRVSILIRLPEHDSLSTMVLEMLTRGRRVIYSKKLPFTEQARDLDEARAALRRCLAQTGPNIRGRKYVLENFSPAAESQRIAGPYRRALSGAAGIAGASSGTDKGS